MNKETNEEMIAPKSKEISKQKTTSTQEELMSVTGSTETSDTKLEKQISRAKGENAKGAQEVQTQRRAKGEQKESKWKQREAT